MSKYDDIFDLDTENPTKESLRYTTYIQTQYEYEGRYSQDDDVADYIRLPRMFTVIS